MISKIVPGARSFLIVCVCVCVCVCVRARVCGTRVQQVMETYLKRCRQVYCVLFGHQVFLTLQSFPVFNKHSRLVRVPLVSFSNYLQLCKLTMNICRKAITISGRTVGNIQPMCSNLGHFFRGHFTFDKKSKQCIFCSFTRSILDGKRLYRHELRNYLTHTSV